MKNQLCFLPDEVSRLGICEHDISSAVLRADRSVVVEIQGRMIEVESVPEGVQQIALCKGGLWCLDESGFVHQYSNRDSDQHWTREHSRPNDSPIESICCFNDGLLCASTHDASMFVFQMKENKWLPQESHFKRDPSDPQAPAQPAAAKPPAKRRIRFSIRTLMLMVLALALLLGPVNYLRQCLKTRMAVNILLAQGDVQFAHQFDANGKRIANAASPEPKWMDRVFGPRLLHRPIAFEQRGRQHLPMDFDSLGKMTTLQKASFLEVDDSHRLNNLVNLQELTIKTCKVNDLSFIENLKELKVLKVGGQMRDSLDPKLTIDITPVCSLPNLEVLEIADVPDLTPISRCLGLKGLKVHCKDTNELQRVIAPLTKLERLSSDAFALDLDWVKHHLGLKSLKLTERGVITDHSPLMQLKQLEELEFPIWSYSVDGVELVTLFDFALFKHAPNLTVERVTLNPKPKSRYGQLPKTSPIVSPEALELGLTNADSIPKSASIAALKTVSLSEQISDLNFFKGASLSKISGPRSQVKDLEVLRGMPLVEVNFNDTAVSDLEPLRGLPLNKLSTANTPIKDISMLTGMKLHSLNISGTRVHDLSALAGSFLKKLNIANTPVSNLPAFEGITDLIMDDSSIKDIQTVSKMSKLERLSLKGTSVSDLSPTIGLSLKYIDASDTKVDRIVDFGWPGNVILDRTKITDLSSLKFNLSSGMELSVSGTPVTDISPLTQMPEFSRLNISYTPITDLSPISKMHLRGLDLSGIKATDFSVLSKLPMLCHLKLADLPLDRIPTLHPKISLREIDLGKTQIKDLSPLFNQKSLRILVLPESADFSQDMIDHWPMLEKLVIGKKYILNKKPKSGYRTDFWHWDRKWRKW